MKETSKHCVKEYDNCSLHKILFDIISYFLLTQLLWLDDPWAKTKLERRDFKCPFLTQNDNLIKLYKRKHNAFYIRIIHGWICQKEIAKQFACNIGERKCVTYSTSFLLFAYYKNQRRSLSFFELQCCLSLLDWSY